MENQTLGTNLLNVNSTSARSSILSAFVGLLVSFSNAVLQILMIYWILGAFGTQFNGFIRVSMALAIVGGTSEGAMGVTTVILMTKPIIDKDWISANEIYSTAKREYRNKFWNALLFVFLVSIAYPLFIVISPMITQNSPAVWTIAPVNSSSAPIPIWELGFICFFYGLKQVISSSFFGIYENILEADKQNYLRRAIILFTDILVYLSILLMLNTTYRNNANYIDPVVTFLPILVYPLIRGFLIRWYVLKKYTWLKYYSDFNEYKLITRSRKLFFSSMSLNILMNFDIFIIFIILGSSGLRISSMLSIYMIIALNIRVIMLTFITSFRDYFLLITLKEGRLGWDKYINYEMYTYIIASFNFIIMAIITRYIAVGLYGSVLQSDFVNITNESVAQTIAEAYGLEFIFGSKGFSILFALSTSFIIVIQGQFVLIEAKGTARKITKWANIIVFIYLFFSVLILFTLYRTNFIDSSQSDWIQKLLVAFYAIKLSFSGIVFAMFWFYIWKYVTYNSSNKGILSNVIFAITPVVFVILFISFFLDKIVKIDIVVNPDDLNNLIVMPKISLSAILSILSLVVFLSLPLCLILPLIFKPKVAASMLLSIPYIKTILQKQRLSSKLQRFAKAGFDTESDLLNSKNFMEQLYKNIRKTSAKDETFILGGELSNYEEKYKYKKNPKIYIVRARKRQIDKNKTT